MRLWLNKCLICIGIFLLLCGNSLATGNSADGKTKSATCVACHGEQGASSSALWPHLAAQGEKYLYRQLAAFKQGKGGPRYNTTMTPLVSNLSDQDMQDLAAYYASQSLVPGKADKNLADKGQQLYRGGDMQRNLVACIACHGPQGLGNSEAAFPLLSGQHAQYVVAQLQSYKNGSRTTDPNNIMHDIASKMTDKDMQAVASYISGLH